MIETASVALARERSSPAGRIIQPGKNCWRVDRADRFYCIQDAADYFRLVRDALLSARHSVFILGWDIYASVDLLPGAAGSDAPTCLDDLLAFVARRRKQLRCYILIWDYAALYTLERDPFSRWRVRWKTPRRVRFGFDDRHPVGGSHHQKIVVVDDHLAFCGGIDLTSHRWDTSAHRIEETARVSAGTPYGPYHEVQAMVSGPAAASLGVLARDRWRALGEKRLPRLATSNHDLWPRDIEPDMTGVDVAISRTMPEVEAEPAIRECELLFFDSIAAAKDSIYVESQYFTNETLGDALAARLREPNGPEIVVVSPKECHGWLEKSTMGVFRDRVFRHLLAADTFGRLRLVYPAASRSQDVPTFVHSKVMVVDDEFVRIGSANFSRRSMGVDSECDLAAEARGDSRVQAGIRRIRDRLLGEHLGMSADDVGREIERTGSMRELIDERANTEHTLARIELPAEPASPPPEALREAADPGEPFLATSLVAGVVPPIDSGKGRPRPALALITNVVLFPPSLMALATGAWSGTLRGGLVALLGSLIMAAIGYAAGRALGPDRIQRWMSRRAYRSARQLGAQGVGGVLVLRLASVASAGSIHLLCGGGRVPASTYMLGTFIGLLPTVFAVAGLGALVRYALVHPTLPNLLLAVGASLLLVTAAALIRTLLLIRRFAPTLASHRAQAEFG
jgi:phosphatidylserine/phosphatidylglycerophosphate/cardiolipin synthase-like enzyme/uncharacterized membrane protein YdjX (TVP38/TMEM64 family)